MGKLVLEVLKEYEIYDRFGYFVLDNALSNNNAVKIILRESGIPSHSQYELRRLRCFGHIINLVAQAFLFGENIKAFETEDYEAMKESYEIY
jgi:hypothetical protein